MDLKTIRQSKGFTQKNMAQVLQISEVYYKMLEKGKRPLTAELEEKIKSAFHFKRTEAFKLEAKFDWIALHFRCTNAKQVVKKILHLPLQQFSEADYVRKHYDKRYYYGHIEVSESKEERQGVLIELTGQACREMEAILAEQAREWYDLFNDCIVYENQLKKQGSKPESSQAFFNVTRLDIALDEYVSEAGNYDLNDLAKKIDEGLAQSRKRKFSITRSGQFSDVKETGITIYVGSASNSVFLRFYRKDAEQAKKLQMSISAVREQYGFYNRYEVVLRHEKSDGFIRDYVANYWDIAQRAVGIINDNVMVFSDWDGHLDEEWYDVMNSYEAYHFTTAPKALNLSQTWIWAEKSVFPTMKLLLQDNPKKYHKLMHEAEIPKRYEMYLYDKMKRDGKIPQRW
ncbi:replication initiation factor domain-containing protein [Lactococcus termiticola]|uniref:Cro/Cl family transcriptional regulator n=1 Tax=Lactococcus termiticola TaxID=2169526 RepID=A0A2R5HH30_9LACT|nr:replication initiation factor domain-containing protein [Lactococcus termiticola]GBG97314.1 Cro/Cl family transcriptional regulator [Lactococcus termiticola]